MIAQLIARLDAPATACARLIARRHMVNRGKTTCYELSLQLKQELQLTRIVVGKEVGALPADAIAKIITATQAKGVDQIEAGLCAKSGFEELTFSAPREIDQRILEVAHYLNVNLASAQSVIDASESSAARVSTRRKLGQELFSIAAQAAFDMAQKEYALPKLALATGLAGSYNHTPLKHSDFDFFVVYKDENSREGAEKVMSYLERICALTLTCNLIRISSADKFDCINISHFTQRGFSLFPRSSSIKIALWDSIFVEGGGEASVFKSFKETLARQLDRHANSRMDGARYFRVMANITQRDSRELQPRARSIEKMIAAGLYMLAVKYKTRVGVGQDYGEIIDHLRSSKAFGQTCAVGLQEAVYVSRVASECLSADGPYLLEKCAMELGFNSASAAAEILNQYYTFAKEFLWHASRAVGMSANYVRFSKIVLDLRCLWDFLKQKYWYGGRQVRSIILPSSPSREA